MTGRMQQLSRTMGVVAALYVVVAAGLLWLAVPHGISGLVLDRSLSVLAGSQLPAQSVRVGDRVVAVNGQRVTTIRELAGVLTRSAAPQAEVTIEERGRLRTATMSRLRWANDPPQDLLSAARIVRVDGTLIGGDMPPSELAAFIERADPTPVEVEYELARTQIGGPLPVRNRAHSPLVLAWIGLGAVGLFGVGLLSAQRLSVRTSALPPAAVGAGGLALAALTAVVVSDGTSPGFAVWAMAGAAAWLGTATAARRADAGGALYGAPAVLLVAGAAWMTVTAAGEETVGGWLRLTDHVVVGGAAVCMAYLLAGVRPVDGEPAWRPWLAGIGCVVGVVLAAWVGASGRASAAEAAAWCVLAAGAAAWPGDLAVFGQVSGSPLRPGRPRPEGGLAEALAGLAGFVPDGVAVHVAAGVDESFVDIVLEDTGIGAGFSTTRAPEPLGGLLAMLALEGGMFPRPAHRDRDAADRDPFADVGEKLGILAAVPVGAHRERAGLAVFALATAEPGTPRPAFDVQGFVDAVADCESGGLVSEAVALAAESLLQRLRRQVRTTGAVPAVEDPAEAPRRPQPATEGAAQAPAPPPVPQPASAADERWAHHLAEELRRDYPVDDPDALNDREWHALGFLRESIRPALIVGEPGVGKEFVARAVHHAMWSSERRLAVVDCSERPPSIVEIELFGDGDTPGLVDAVGPGTLVLKSASALGQARLEGLVARFSRSRARLVFAERYTGPEAGVPRAVPEAIRSAVEDRNIHLSPLRDRPEDTLRYARYFLHRAAMRYDAMVTGFAPEAEDWLAEQALPGNLHELSALVTAAVLRTDGDLIDVEHFAGPEAGAASTTRERRPSTPVDLTPDEEGERRVILDALEAHDGNRTRAAEALDMTRGSLLRRLRKYGID